MILLFLLPFIAFFLFLFLISVSMLDYRGQNFEQVNPNVEENKCSGSTKYNY